MNIQYVTGNKGKFEEAVLLLQAKELEEVRLHFTHTPLHLDEIQGTAQEIASHKIIQAHKILNAPCIIDDVSLYCPAIGNLPGPYIRPFLEALGDDGFAKLIAKYSDHFCTVECTIAYMSPDHASPLFFEGRIHGKIVFPRGSRKHHKTSWNAIVEPEGETRTFAEMSLEEMSRISPRSKALFQFRNHLRSTHT